MFERHARRARILRWQSEGIDEAGIRTRIQQEDPAWHAALGSDPFPTDPLGDLIHDASFDTLLTGETLKAEGSRFEDDVDDDWDLVTLTWIGRIVSAVEALGHAGRAAREAEIQVLESMRRARFALVYDWPAYYDWNPYLQVMDVAGPALARIGAPATEVLEDVRARGKRSRWYEVFAAMVREAPDQVPPDLISVLVAEGDAALLQHIPVERWPLPAVTDALGLDLFDHIQSRIALEPRDESTLDRLVRGKGPAFENLTRLGERGRVAIPLLEALLREHAADEARVHARTAERAARALEAVGGPSVEALLRDPSPSLRRVAVRVLASRPTGCPSVLEAMRDPDPMVRRTAVKHIVAFSSPEVLGAVRAALRDPDGRVRRRALDAVGALRPPDMRDLFRAALDDPDGVTGWTATWWLRETEPADAESDA